MRFCQGLQRSFNSESSEFIFQRLHEMADGELKDMEYFFATLPNPFTAFDSEAYKTSVVGGC